MPLVVYDFELETQFGQQTAFEEPPLWLLVTMMEKEQGASIALLQERFRKLERVKKKREGRELLKISLAEPPQQPSSGPSSDEQQHIWFFSDLLSPSTPLNRPKSNFSCPSKHAKFCASEISLSVGLWLERPAASCTTMNYDVSRDVDTSLHL